MSNLYDTTFWIHVGVAAILITIILLAINWPKIVGRRRVNIEVVKAQAVVNETIRCIRVAQSMDELQIYQTEADNLFMAFYDILGRKECIAFYESMTDEVIRRGKELQKQSA